MAELKRTSVKQSPNPDLLRAVEQLKESLRKLRDSSAFRRNNAFELLQKLQYAKDHEAMKSITFFSTLISSIEKHDSIRHYKFDFFDSDKEIEYAAHGMTPVDFPLNETEFKKIYNWLLDKETNVLPGHCVYNVLRAAAEQLRLVPNVNKIRLRHNTKVCVCGSLQGSLKDLLQIFEKNGLPSKDNIYVFNGNIVDVGPKNIEVLTLILAAYLVYPKSVFLNRGKHEDSVMNACYEFHTELEEKYPRGFVRILQWLDEVWRFFPLATVVNNSVFIVSGGITRQTNLNTIEKLRRRKYASLLRPSSADLQKQDWMQMLTLMWSSHDFCTHMPHPNLEVVNFVFSATDTMEFLKAYKFTYMISSNICVRDGYQELHNDKLILLWSATDFYAPQSNAGAFLRISKHLEPEYVVLEREIDNELTANEAIAVPANGAIEKKPVKEVPTDEAVEEIEKEEYVESKKKAANDEALVAIGKAASNDETETGTPTDEEYEETAEKIALLELKMLLYDKYRILEEAFQEYDIDNNGVIRLGEWCTALEAVTGLRLPWFHYSGVLTGIDQQMISLYNAKFDYNLTLEILNSADVRLAYAKRRYTHDMIFINLKSVEAIFVNIKIKNKFYPGQMPFQTFEIVCDELSDHLTYGPRARKLLFKLFEIVDKNKDGFIGLHGFFDIFSFYLQYQQNKMRHKLRAHRQKI